MDCAICLHFKSIDAAKLIQECIIQSTWNESRLLYFVLNLKVNIYIYGFKKICNSVADKEYTV